MTTTTSESIGLETRHGRPSVKLRFTIAFLIGLIAALGLGTGAMYAYDQQYVGRVLPGVRIGSIDLSGLDRDAAAEQIRTTYAALGEGEVMVQGPDGALSIPFKEFGRGPDVEAMLDEAMGIGRNGDALERALANARTAMRGAVVAPRVTYDVDLLARRVTAFASSLAVRPVEASVRITDALDFVVVPGRAGRVADGTSALSAAVSALGALDAPARVDLKLDVQTVEPVVTTTEASEARASAEQMAADVGLTVEGKTWTIPAKTLRPWISFAPTADGGYAPSIDTAELDPTLKKLAKKIDQTAINASYRTRGGKITGVTPSQTGYKMDRASTVAQVHGLLVARAGGTTMTAIEPTLKVTRPVLTTEEAEAAQPRMRRVSTWTTYFPLTIKNGYGVNIWLPTRLIDGYVVAPRATFDFWDAIGPVTRAKGYKTGGAIINGRTEPQGALAGGICTCSTTLFNAALQGGYEMGARRNHYYYIDRYPLGLDATVFISASGAKQTMSFTNDTDYPILIRGYQIREGDDGWVKFDLVSVPTGRKVSLSKPIVRDVRPGKDSIEYTDKLPPGETERIESPVDGKKVTVSRTVRDRNGNVIHRDTYFSNYARITGITLVGQGTVVPPEVVPPED